MTENNEFFLNSKFKEAAKFIKKDSKILDIGCNNGRFREFIPESDYYGVDIDSDLIKILNKKGINAKQADINKNILPFGNIKFEYITLMDILEHVLDPEKLLLDSKNRLNKGGKLIVTLPNDYHILNKIRFILNKPLTENPFAPYGHLHFFSIKDGEKFLVNRGFKIINKIPISPVKPAFLPQKIKNFLGKTFPQSFARDILYVLEIS
jgi:methionine biosynthesis protein MetW